MITDIEYLEEVKRKAHYANITFEVFYYSSEYQAETLWLGHTYLSEMFATPFEAVVSLAKEILEDAEHYQKKQDDLAALEKWRRQVTRAGE